MLVLPDNRKSRINVSKRSLTPTLRWATAIDVGADRIDIPFRPTTGPRVGSTSAPSVPIGYANRSAPRTHFLPISSPTRRRDALHEIIDKVLGYCEDSGIRGNTVTLKLKLANFQLITRSRTGQMHIRTRSELEQLSNTLLEPLFLVTKGVRLLGVSLSSLSVKEADRDPNFSRPF